MKRSQHISEEENFYKSFIDSLLKNKLVFLCNGKDKLNELKNSFSKIGEQKRAKEGQVLK